MRNPVFRPLHLPRRPKARPSRRLLASAAGALPPPCLLSQEPLGQNDGRPLKSSWRSQAVREGVLVTLLTTLLTSAVLAAPEMFRQSPLSTLGQFLTAGQSVGQPASIPLLLDCP